MKPVALLFDFDGVVVDSEVHANAALARALTDFGLPTSYEDSLAIYIGLNSADRRAEIARRLAREISDADIEWLRTHILSQPTPEAVPVAGLPGFLDRIGTLPRAIASSSHSAYIREHLNACALSHHFGDHIFSAAEHVARGKPHPDIYLHAAHALGVRAEEAVVIEDTPVGVRAAVAAGATVIGLCAGGHCRADHGERLRAAGAHHVAMDYNAVARLIGLSPA